MALIKNMISSRSWTKLLIALWIAQAPLNYNFKRMEFEDL